MGKHDISGLLSVSVSSGEEVGKHERTRLVEMKLTVAQLETDGFSYDCCCLMNLSSLQSCVPVRSIVVPVWVKIRCPMSPLSCL